MQFSVYQQTHIGGRKVNQDRMGYSFTRDALLLVLADGMGGHLHGEIAATIALQTLSMMFRMQARPYVKKPERFLEEALLQAHHDIQAYAVTHGLPRILVLLSPMIGFCLALWAIARHLGRVDEYLRSFLLESFALAAGLTAGLTFSYGFLETAGYPRMSMFAVWVVLCGATMLVCLVRSVHEKLQTR